MQILLANPRGFCAGVDRAISIVENALAIFCVMSCAGLPTRYLGTFATKWCITATW
ncbi:4-hydroxy-3-methylbut-2-enyl diphosphate reductase [Cronobacter muytjensii 530]